MPTSENNWPDMPARRSIYPKQHFHVLKQTSNSMLKAWRFSHRYMKRFQTFSAQEQLQILPWEKITVFTKNRDLPCNAIVALRRSKIIAENLPSLLFVGHVRARTYIFLLHRIGWIYSCVMLLLSKLWAVLWKKLIKLIWIYLGK